MKTSNPPIEVTPAEVEAARQKGEAMLLLDCRRPEERAFASIEGSLFVPMDEIGGRLDELRGEAEKTIVIYCHTGRRSLIVARALRQAGFANACSMAGGIERWSLEIDPSVPRY